MGQPFSVYQAMREVREGNEHLIVIVSGNDPDVVWSAALDIKNGAGLHHAPEIGGLEASSIGGWWSCTLVYGHSVSTRGRS